MNEDKLNITEEILEFANTLKEKKLSLSTAESLTGGRLADVITNVSGISSVYKLGLVVYQNSAKEEILNVNKKLLEEYGAVSKECCYEMCKNLISISNTDIAISTTGNAGPSAMEGKKVGLVYIGVNYNNKIVVEEHLFDGNRDNIKNLTVLCAIKLAKKCLMNID